MKARAISWSSLIILALVASSGALYSAAQGKGKKPKEPKETPVTVTYHDNTADRIQSDGVSPYINGVDGVRAVLLSGGNLLLDTRDGARTLFLDFSLGIPDPDENIPMRPTGSHAVFMLMAPVDCTGVPAGDPCPNLDGGFRAVTGTDVPARLVLNFADPLSSDEFRLRMGPNPVNEDQFLFTDYLVVSCKSPANGSCTKWDVATNDSKDVARLFRHTPRQKGGIKATTMEVGDFHMPHGLTITVGSNP